MTDRHHRQPHVRFRSKGPCSWRNASSRHWRGKGTTRARGRQRSLRPDPRAAGRLLLFLCSLGAVAVAFEFTFCCRREKYSQVIPPVIPVERLHDLRPRRRLDARRHGVTVTADCRPLTDIPPPCGPLIVPHQPWPRDTPILDGF